MRVDVERDGAEFERLGELVNLTMADPVNLSTLDSEDLGEGLSKPTNWR